MMLYEVIFDRVGVGLYGMHIYVISTIFIAGLMIGRKPEFLITKEFFSSSLIKLQFFIDIDSNDVIY